MKYQRRIEDVISVEKIRWEHIYLYITLSGKNVENCSYWIANANGVRYPLTRKGRELCLNMVDIPDIHVLPSDKWLLLAEDAIGGAQVLQVLPECGYQLEQLDKIYRYSAENCAYAVTFGIWDGHRVRSIILSQEADYPEDVIDTENMYLYIHTDYLRRNRTQAKRNILAETRGVKGFLHGVFIRCSKMLLQGIYSFLCVIRHHDGKHILLMSETRIPIGGNLKALDERMKERGINREYHISYSFSKTLQQGKLSLVKNWGRLLWLIAGQDYIFVDDYVPIFQSIRLKPETKLIQLWHAGVGFKSVGYARFGRPGSPHPIESCHRRYDYAVVGARGLIPVYQEVFGLSEEHFRAYGLPRLDGYGQKEKVEAFREKFYGAYPELLGKKIILFAPTFRGNGQGTAYYPMERVDLRAAWEMCGEEYAFVLKMHPFVPPLAPIPEELRDRIYDFSEGMDINELFYVTEILITDFSSNIYEFSLQNKPMLFYAFDRDYYQLTRGVHRRLEEFAPGKICDRFDELMEAIRRKDFCEERRERFIMESFEKHEGYASDRIIDEIILGRASQ